jgi:succinate dehydrogenase / fumarate reductase cytochrome b subunit
LNWLARALSSSVGKKYVMGLTGLFLCLFLVVHLAGNLLMYVGPEAYNHYAHNLHDNAELLLIVQVLLYAAFLAHLIIAITLTKQNAAARGQKNAVVKSKIEGRQLYQLGLSPDSTMFITGVIILAFTIYHVAEIKFEMLYGESFEARNPYDQAMYALDQGLTQLVYTIGSLFVGIHVSHGLYSACQSIGFNHPKYTPCIQWFSKVFGFIVAIGFASFGIMRAFKILH